MGFNLAMRCETCKTQTGVLRGYENAALAVFGRDHPSSEGHVKKLQVDNGWSRPEPTWEAGPDGYGDERIFPPDYPPEDQPARYKERGY